MAGFMAGLDRGQTTLLPECLEDWVDENNSVRAVDVFVEALDLRDLGFEGVDAAGIGRPSYRPGAAQTLHLRLFEPRAIERSS
jgi:transposase